ncbi:hypothetical protein [Moorella sp. Hama-1]|uniref:hypothetical protein n=1 Tax=Moorella sp. Hama-1 TaxID=2138101 RepID=UPI00352A879B
MEAKIKTLLVEQPDDLAEKIPDITSEAELLRVLALKHRYLTSRPELKVALASKTGRV